MNCHKKKANGAFVHQAQVAKLTNVYLICSNLLTSVFKNISSFSIFCQRQHKILYLYYVRLKLEIEWHTIFRNENWLEARDYNLFTLFELSFFGALPHRFAHFSLFDPSSRLGSTHFSSNLFDFISDTWFKNLVLMFTFGYKFQSFKCNLSKKESLN